MNEQIMQDVMTADVLIVTNDTPVRPDPRSRRPEQVVVLMDEAGRPMGVLPAVPDAGSLDAGATFGDFRERYLSPTLTTPQTPVRAALAAMAYDKTIRWFVVLEGSAIQGVVAPLTLFRLANSLLRRSARADVPETDAEQRRLDERLGGAAGDIWGDPDVAPSGLCYRCSRDASHRYEPEQVQQRDAWGRALCPVDLTVMSAENPCQGTV